MLTYADCLAFTLLHEGGFVDNPEDPGGATNQGITLRALSAYEGRDCAAADLRAMTPDTRDTIYQVSYWTAAGCYHLPPSVALIVFDAGVMSSPARSVRFLQAAIGVTQDGACGPVTQAAAANASPADLCQRLHDRQAAFYRADPLASRFPGWFRRNDDRLALALASLTPATS